MTSPAHSHAYSPDGLTDESVCLADPGCPVTYLEYLKTRDKVPVRPLIPGPDGDLPTGWHRVKWTQGGREHYVVSDDLASVVKLCSLLRVLSQRDAWAGITDVTDMESWKPAG